MSERKNESATADFFGTPSTRRREIVLLGIAGGLMALFLVAVNRHVGQHLIGILVPAWWYLVAALPCALGVSIALALPTNHRCWRSLLFVAILLAGILTSFLPVPLIYGIYDFENPRGSRSTRAAPIPQ
jgi:hypothetical protein